MPQLPSINDNEVDLWRKLVENSAGISPIPPGNRDFSALDFNISDFA